MNILIKAEGLSKEYGSGDAVVTALSEAAFTIEEGEFVSIMGESGSGKSTLLSILGGLNSPTRGSLEVGGIDVYGLGSEQRADFRREFLGFVFQNFNLVEYLTVGENVMLPLATTRIAQRTQREMATRALAQVGLEDKIDRLPNQISGGEQERVAVARAVVNDPPLLLADEPTGNLDSRNTGEVMKLLKELNEQGMTVLMVTHSEACAAYANRTMSMADGALVWASPE
jgi:putative ABC transport system ATP-binding protein